MVQTPLTRVERKKEKTRRILMEVALGLFYEKGIYWTKIEDITERADIGKGTFYQYFETKEALLQALLQDGLEALLARTREALQGAKPGEQALSRIIQVRLDFFQKHAEYLLLFHQVRGLLQLKTEPTKELREVYDQYFDRLGRLMKLALDGKGAQGVSGRELALAISAFTSGLLTHQLLFGREGDRGRRPETMQRQLERSVQALL